MTPLCAACIAQIDEAVFVAEGDYEGGNLPGRVVDTVAFAATYVNGSALCALHARYAWRNS